MKKLIIAAAMFCVAAASQAASVMWELDMVNDLKIDGITVDFSNGQANWIIFENSAAYSSGDIWKQYQDNTLAGSKMGELDTDTGLYWADPGMMQIAGGDSYKEGDKVYFASILIYNEDKDFTKPSYYMVNTGMIEASEAGATMMNIGNTIGGEGGTGATTWQAAAVPEPTSGLLLLLGVAGLALRRRRA